MKRRQLLQTLSVSSIAYTGMGRWIRSVQADGQNFFRYHDPRGDDLLAESLDRVEFWNGSELTQYPGYPYDQIRIKEDNRGIVTFISGTGNTTFTPALVAEGIFEHQNIIPQYMSRLKVGEYLGRGVDSHHGLAYTDMFFLADIKIFYMSVPLRTVRYPLGDGRFICAIELVTENMVSPDEWVEYTSFMRTAEATLQGDWTIFPVVPMEYLVGYYLVEPDTVSGARVSMTTRMQFKQDVSWVADWGAQLSIVLRQGMIAGFMGSVEACKHLKSTRLEASP